MEPVASCGEGTTAIASTKPLIRLFPLTSVLVGLIDTFLFHIKFKMWSDISREVVPLNLTIVAVKTRDEIFKGWVQGRSQTLFLLGAYN